jgi:hypothetical protein
VSEHRGAKLLANRSHNTWDLGILHTRIGY